MKKPPNGTDLHRITGGRRPVPDRVRVLSRRPGRITGAGPGRVEPVAGSITDAAAVRRALDGAGRVVVCVASPRADGGPNGPTPVHLDGRRNVVVGAAPVRTWYRSARAT